MLVQKQGAEGWQVVDGAPHPVGTVVLYRSHVMMGTYFRGRHDIRAGTE